MKKGPGLAFRVRGLEVKELSEDCRRVSRGEGARGSRPNSVAGSLGCSPLYEQSLIGIGVPLLESLPGTVSMILVPPCYNPN